MTLLANNKSNARLLNYATFCHDVLIYIYYNVDFVLGACNRFSGTPWLLIRGGPMYNPLYSVKGLVL